jgi:hypothetical protein
MISARTMREGQALEARLWEPSAGQEAHLILAFSSFAAFVLRTRKWLTIWFPNPQGRRRNGLLMRLNWVEPRQISQDESP